jgi:hypothetical protein
MAPPQFSVRAEYRGPHRSADNWVGTEGCRSPGNLPRVFGMLNSELAEFGTMPADGCKSGTLEWSRFAPTNEFT